MAADPHALAPPPTPQAIAHRWRWAALLRRVFKVDVASCPRCKHPLQLIALIAEAAALSRILDHLGRAAPPPPEPARLPQQTECDFELQPIDPDSVYQAKPRQIASGVELLLDHQTMVVQDADVVKQALAQYRQHPSLGFSDCLILETAQAAGHEPLGSFDRRLGKLPGAQRP